ncbi:MAG: hypothetical protein QM762_12435 [Chryseolinea sp.]
MDGIGFNVLRMPFDNPFQDTFSLVAFSICEIHPVHKLTSHHARNVGVVWVVYYQVVLDYTGVECLV